MERQFSTPTEERILANRQSVSDELESLQIVLDPTEFAVFSVTEDLTTVLLQIMPETQSKLETEINGD